MLIQSNRNSNVSLLNMDPQAHFHHQWNPLSSEDLARFMQNQNIDHIASSSLYPRPNGFIERQVKTIKTAMNTIRQQEHCSVPCYQTSALPLSYPSCHLPMKSCISRPRNNQTSPISLLSRKLCATTEFQRRPCKRTIMIEHTTSTPTRAHPWLGSTIPITQ